MSALVKTLEQVKPSIRFIHIRHSCWAPVAGDEEGTVYERIIDSRGGITVAFKVDKDDSRGGLFVRYAVAYCHDDDNFNRDTGRRIATRRLRHIQYAEWVTELQLPPNERPRKVILDEIQKTLNNGYKFEVVKHGKRSIPTYEEVETS